MFLLELSPRPVRSCPALVTSCHNTNCRRLKTPQAFLNYVNIVHAIHVAVTSSTVQITQLRASQWCVCGGGGGGVCE